MRRKFEARVSLDYLGGDARLTETVFGWSRHTVAKGIKEFNSGRAIADAPRASKPKTEDANPQLARDIVELVEPDSQTDPKFQGLFKYTRLTVKGVREKLIEHKHYTSDALPHESTIRNMLDRLGYKMRRVLKAKPKKKSPKPMRSSTTSTKPTPRRMRDPIPCEFRSTPKPC